MNFPLNKNDHFENTFHTKSKTKQKTRNKEKNNFWSYNKK